MTMDLNAIDLVILTADRSIEAALRGILSRYKSLGIRPISYNIYSYPHRDPGCRTESHLFLQPFVNQYKHALVVFDREGCGRESIIAADIENDVKQRLSNNGWNNRADVIILDPELEIWVWSDSPHVSDALGWAGNVEGLQHWLISEGFSIKGRIKPNRPKEALHQILKLKGIPRSSSLFYQLAQKVGFERCQDPAFQKFKGLMRQWFPA